MTQGTPLPTGDTTVTEPKRESLKLGDYESVALDNGWYMIRRAQTEGADGQWIAAENPRRIRQ